MLEVLKPLAPIIGLALFVFMFIYAGVMVFSLFTERLGSDEVEGYLAVAASVGIVFGTLLIALSSSKHSVRGLAGLCLLFWLIITLTLVSLEAAARGGLLAVPDSLSSIGKVVAALLSGLALIPVIIIPMVARHPDTYPSSAAAMSYYIGFIAKAVGIGASMFASVYFGIARSIPVEVALLCGVLLESSFLWSYFALIKARQRGDGFDMVIWTLATILYGTFIALVGVETITTLAHINVPFLKPLGEIGEQLYGGSIGLTIGLAFITHFLNIPVRRGSRNGNQVVDGNSRPLAHRMAGSIRGARAGMREIGSAIRDVPEQLPARTATRPEAAVTYADDAPADAPAIRTRTDLPDRNGLRHVVINGPVETPVRPRAGTDEVPSFLSRRPGQE
jgi:hypothetical protein